MILLGKKLVLTLNLLFLIFCSTLLVQGELPVGVKQGDWIEYNVATTGNPPPEHNVTWARMEIMRVQGDEVDVNVTTQAHNGTVSSLVMDLNLSKGVIGAWWIIPANLSPGDTFYEDFLNISVTIDGQEQLEYAGAVRTITNATIPTRIKQWDKETGVFVLSSDNLPDYTIRVEAYATNMWVSQILGLNPIVFYVIVVAVVAVIVASIMVVARRRRRKHNEPSK